MPAPGATGSLVCALALIVCLLAVFRNPAPAEHTSSPQGLRPARPPVAARRPSGRECYDGEATSSRSLSRAGGGIFWTFTHCRHSSTALGAGTLRQPTPLRRSQRPWVACLDQEVGVNARLRTGFGAVLTPPGVIWTYRRLRVLHPRHLIPLPGEAVSGAATASTNTQAAPRQGPGLTTTHQTCGGNAPDPETTTPADPLVPRRA